MPYAFEDVKDNLDVRAHYEEVIGTPWYPDARYDTFSHAEYRRRHELLREKMRSRGLDCVIASGSGSNWSFGAGMFWLSGLRLHAGLAQYVILPLEDEPTLVVATGGAVAEAVRRSVAIADVRPAHGGRFGEVIADRLEELGLSQGHIGLLEFAPGRNSDALPVNHLETLQTRLPAAKFILVRDLYHEMLYVKSAEEIAAIERSGALLDDAFQAMYDVAQPGATEYDVMAAAADAIIGGGGEVGFLIIGSTATADPCIPFGSPRPSGRRLRQGDVIVNELSGGVRGYTAQFGHPIFVGEPAPAVRRFWDEIVVPGFKLLSSYMRPGVTAEELQEAGQFYRQHGAQGRPLLLHGMDVTTSRPRIGVERIIADDFERTFKPGMTLMLEPDAITADGLLGLFVGRTYVITADGGYAVSKTPLEMFVK